MKNIEHWDCDDSAEMLYHEDFDEAVEAFLDGQVEIYLGEEIEVYGYARMSVNKSVFAKVILESASDFLGDPYDGEDGHEQNEAIKTAAATFVETYLENYEPWACQIVKTKTVNVADWVKKNRPDWLLKKKP